MQTIIVIICIGLLASRRAAMTMLRFDMPPLLSATGHHVGSERPQARARSIDSARLLEGAREIVIRHGDACYRLIHTRNDKLILTK